MEYLNRKYIIFYVKKIDKNKPQNRCKIFLIIFAKTGAIRLFHDIIRYLPYKKFFKKHL